MKLLLTTLFLSITFSVINAQIRIAVTTPSTGVTKIVPSLDSALTIAVNGDNIYLSGGSFRTSKAIDKSIHIYGAGYNTDSSSTTGITQISNTIQISTGADGGSIEGINFAPNCGISVVRPISNYTIAYCYIYSGIGFTVQSNNSASVSITIKNNYIGASTYNINGDAFSIFGNINNSFISGNIITFSTGILPISDQLSINNIYANNYFLNIFSLSNNCTYKNNIFQSQLFYCSNSVFNNNINSNYVSGSGNIITGNINEDLASTMISPGTYGQYDVHNNYHVKPTSLAHSAGTDGTDIGIYGGLYPWKDGSFPSNPHISLKQVDLKTNANGTLNATFKVITQSN